MLAIVSAALVASAVSAAPLAASDRIVVGGSGTLGVSSVRVGAVSGPAGAQGTMIIESSPGFVFRIRVTCVRQLFGGLVLVGGVIVQATNPATIGHTSEIGVVDRRDVAAPDLLGIAFSSSGLDSCPFAPPVFPISNGNLIVRNS
jgi:hypothetical protein